MHKAHTLTHSKVPLMTSILRVERHLQPDSTLHWPLSMIVAAMLTVFQVPLTMKGCQSFLLQRFKGSFVWLTWLEGRRNMISRIGIISNVICSSSQKGEEMKIKFPVLKDYI